MRGFTVTVITLGVLQQLLPELAIVSQEPPVVVVAVALKVKLVLVLTMLRIWGSGFAPPKGLVKASAGTGSND
jgi:hypothetical protein